jgi:hypothetical protein
MEQGVPKRRHMKFRRWGITRKKTYNIQNTAKVWNQEVLFCLFVCPVIGIFVGFFTFFNSFESRSSWEVFSAAQEVHRILWNPKVRCGFGNSLLLVPVLKQISPVYANPTSPLPSCFLKIYFNIILPSTPFLYKPKENITCKGNVNWQEKKYWHQVGSNRNESLV